VGYGGEGEVGGVYHSAYDTWEYYSRFADPGFAYGAVLAKTVGRLVLRVAGYERDDLDAASDAVCSALQLANFWQDIEIDRRKGRLYVPASIWQTAGAREEDLDDRRLTPPWRTTMAEVTRRTRALFAAGRPVADGVTGRLRYELRATWLGGNRILDKLEAADYDMFSHRPALTRTDVPVIAWQMLRWRTRG